MSTALIAPLVRAHPDIEWVSFQVGPREREARELGLTIPTLTDFDDTARWLSGVDLLITVDTATAHLAGAMGVPTWLCIPAVPDMRWPLRGDKPPWYDSMRIYRQPTLGDWRSVVSALHKSLTARDL
jgi:ADP-heptose:LPS heptosyltransferase